ncbi:PLP-dependent transferase, partial [Bacillus sp. JJ1503]
HIRIETGVCNRLLRFSVGIENTDDIIQDLELAFAKVLEGVTL